jgi:hypothetical protein
MAEGECIIGKAEGISLHSTRTRRATVHDTAIRRNMISYFVNEGRGTRTIRSGADLSVCWRGEMHLIKTAHMQDIQRMHRRRIIA